MFWSSNSVGKWHCWQSWSEGVPCTRQWEGTGSLCASAGQDAAPGAILWSLHHQHGLLRIGLDQWPLSGIETSLMLPGFPFLALPVVAFGRENKQASSWDVVSHSAKVAGEQLVWDVRDSEGAAHQPPVFSRRKDCEERISSGSGGALQQRLCCYLGWLFGFCRWLALMMLWVGFSSPDSWYLLKRFLRDHPKNKPASSKVYSVRAWSWKLAPILLSFPVKCICFLLMLQFFVVMGPLWPFSMPWVLHGPRGRAKKEPEPQCKEHERGKMPWWQGLAGFGKSGRSCFMPPSWLQGPAGVQQGWKGDALLLLHASLPLHFTCGIGAYPGLHSWARLEKQSPALCLTE